MAIRIAGPLQPQQYQSLQAPAAQRPKSFLESAPGQQLVGKASGAQGGLGAAGQAFCQQAAANQALSQSGTQQQQQAQNEQDAAYQGIQRLFGLINPGTVGQTATTTQTGGGK